jgi:hypothetical protein
MAQEVAYFENLTAMPADGPFVVCHVKLNCYRVEVAPHSGIGCPRTPSLYVFELLRDNDQLHSDRSHCVFFRREDALATADWLNAGLVSGLVDPALIRSY